MVFQQWYRENIAGKGLNVRMASRSAWIYQQKTIEGQKKALYELHLQLKVIESICRRIC